VSTFDAYDWSLILTVSMRCFRAAGSILTLAPATCVEMRAELPVFADAFREPGLTFSFAIFASSISIFDGLSGS